MGNRRASRRFGWALADAVYILKVGSGTAIATTKTLVNGNRRFPIIRSLAHPLIRKQRPHVSPYHTRTATHHFGTTNKERNRECSRRVPKTKRGDRGMGKEARSCQS